jgi:hypothetical protein
VAVHFGFSWIGFNPTDEGWLQAVARRLLAGEVPHRDFISLRPVFSALLQVPLVWLGGDHVFWLARLWGWLVVGGISWLWSGCLLPDQPARWLRTLLYPVIFFLNAQVFPVMAWHSLDGLLLATAALALARRGTPAAWRGAFLCAGFAAMCRQNFVFFIPFLALGLPDWKQGRAILWIGVAPALYLAFLLGTGAAGDFVHQILATQGQLFRTAVQPYGEQPAFFAGLGLGALAAGALHLARRGTGRGPDIVATALLLATGLYASFNLWHGPLSVAAGAFGLFGAACALLAVAVATRRVTRSGAFPLIAAVGLAWTAAISVGYNSPALTGGVLLVATWRLLESLAGRPVLTTPAGLAAIGLALAGLALTFREARFNFPYQERPAAELSWDAGAVMRGAAGLRTNAVTYAVLEDLRRLTDHFDRQHQPYAIMTDYAAFWVGSAQRNPLACEWPQTTELGADPTLTSRFIRQMCSLPPGAPIIVQKDLISTVPGGLFPVSAAKYYYYTQTWLEEHGQQVGETTYFKLYLSPRWRDDAPPAVK